LKKGEPRQQWVFDMNTKTVRTYFSSWKNYSWEMNSNGNNHHMVIKNNSKSRWWALFKYQGNYVINERGCVFSVNGN
jgi:hypothetical protein